MVVCTSIIIFQSGHRAFALAAEHGCVEMMDTLTRPYNMDTMKPNKVCVDFKCFWFVCYLCSCVWVHICVLHLQWSSLMPVFCLPPFCQRGETPLHLAARNGHLDAVQSLLQSFDTRDEVNMVDNQCKHPLYHGLVCDSVCSVANPLLVGGSTSD